MSPFVGTRYPSLRQFARVTSERIRATKHAKVKPALKSLECSEEASQTVSETPAGTGKAMEVKEVTVRRQENTLPLSDVVANCVRRWFRDALVEAKAGDTAMQVLVGQMYHSGYGVPPNKQKAKAWLAKASRYRSSVWKVGEKLPGYGASDSDSDDTKNEKS
ncbi:hypothetical protein HPP92_024850 [Vanilla planifolia]|uniref:Uncharacterized protein n=1 Tax=Vanilla planifolia TaxID=51239 RepID=A0A835PES8_VANPL|nr:hypothetical protein HPP92_025114 [Vanilla planifolia]KAG0453546.1 hypothetical protein HPP92_024850 [Vanilla planifolia]